MTPVFAVRKLRLTTLTRFFLSLFLSSSLPSCLPACLSSFLPPSFPFLPPHSPSLLSFFPLFERLREKGKERKDLFYLLIDFPEAHKSQGRARPHGR